MKNYAFTKTIFLIIFLFLANFSSLNASSASGIDVNLQVGGCNNNGICEAGQEDMLSCPLDCTPTPVTPTNTTTTGSIIYNFFKDLTIEVSYNSVVIKWKSNVPTMTNFKWGTNSDYKDGIIKNVDFLLDHKIELNNLNDGTIYYFNIQATNFLGVTNTLENKTFQTLSLPDTTPPGNPTNVKISSAKSGITVSWTNPKDIDFDYIRVMRNEDRYYGSPFIGKVVYEGNGNYFTDSNVKEGHKYFYTLFSRDRAGNYSSGSLIDIIHNPLGLDNWGNELPPVEETSQLPGVVFILNQDSSTYDFYPGSVFNLNGDSTINIKTNYSSKIKNDDMWIEVRNSDGIIIAQYFFSREKDKDGFVNVTVPYFKNGGYYRVTVYRYNYGISQIVNHGDLNIKKNIIENKIIWSFWYVLWFIIIILIILIFIFLLFFKILPKIFKHFYKNKEK